MDALVLALVLVALAVAAHYLQRRKMIQTVEMIPGPPAYPVIGNTIDLAGFKFNLTTAIEFWTAKYGDIFRVWFGNKPFIVLTKPEDLEILLSSNKHIEKAELYGKLHPWIGDGLLTSTGKHWHTRRKLITPSFHFKILDQFVDVFNRRSTILVEKLLATKEESVDIHHYLALCTLDIICETAMGTKVDAQNDSESSYVMAVHDALVSFHRRTMKPWLHLDGLFNLFPEGKTFNAAVKILHKYTLDVIESRRSEREGRLQQKESSKAEDDVGLKKREAFLDQLLEADSAGANLTDSDIREEVDTFMFEGHDTTAAALSFIFYNIAANPHVQEKIVEELEDIFGDSDRPATSQDIQNMKYTERVVKESLRMYPSVPLFARFLRDYLPVTGGYVLPAGGNITISCLQMGRNAKHWPEPERFDPDRFLPENSVGRHPYAYVPFSAGPRNCIGQKFAMMEMKSAVAKVVRHCEVKLPRPGYKPLVEGQVILKAPEGVMLNFTPRKRAAASS